MNLKPEPKFDVTAQLAMRGFRILENAITPDAEQVMIEKIVKAFGKTPARGNENDRSRVGSGSVWFLISSRAGIVAR